jgi:hypothetical protein
VAQPFLDLTGGCTVLMSVGRKVLAEPMQNPVLTHRGVGTRDGLAVLDALHFPQFKPPLNATILSLRIK